MVNKIGYSIVEQLTKNRFFITHPLLEILKKIHFRAYTQY